MQNLCKNVGSLLSHLLNNIQISSPVNLLYFNTYFYTPNKSAME